MPEAGSAETLYNLRRKTWKAALRQANCPCKGLLASEWAVGTPERVVKSALAQYKRLLLMACMSLEPSARDSIKIGQHKQLPLVLAGVTARDEEEAR